MLFVYYVRRFTMAREVMTKPEVARAKRRLKALEASIAECTPLMRGSIVSNGARHRQPYFSLNKDGKTHLIYLGEDRLPAARSMSDNYRRLLEIVEEMTLINMKLLKNDSAPL